MKKLLMLSIIAALLGGCVIAPAGYRENGDGYYRERSYSRGDGYYRDSGNRGEYGYQGNMYRDHGG